MPEKVEEAACSTENEKKDTRGDYAKVAMIKNKLRAMGVKNPVVMVASEEAIAEEESDRMRDRRQEVGGVSANADQKPVRKPAPGSQRSRKRRSSAPSALDIVRAETEKKFGKGSLM